MKNIKNILSSIQFFLLTAVLLLFTTQFTWAVTSSYYTSLNGKSGTDLFSAAHSVAKTGYSSGVSYNGLWTVYCSIDINSSGKVWDMYSNATSYTCGGSAQGANYSKEGDAYNREHSIPKSWFGGSTNSGTPGTDLFHVVPTDGYVNNMRSAYAFGEVSSATYTSQSGCKKGSPKSITISNTILNTSGSSTQSCSQSIVFEPMDEYKGDFARGYFGTMVKWASGDYQTFTTSEGASMFNTAYDADHYYGLTAYGVALLMKWHREDPVSQKEIDRNNGIQTNQGNRNPFIDYPCLAEYLWGEHAGETFNLSNVVGSFESGFSVGSSSGCTSGGTTTNYTITWVVNGSTYATNTSNGTSIATFPTDPSAPTTCSSKVFVGWSTTNIGSTEQSSAPSVLFTSSNTSSAPSIDSNKTFYAVFATASSGGSSSTISFDISGLNGQGTSGTGGSISATTSGITFACDKGYGYSTSQVRCYSGSNITISSTVGNISAIAFTFSSSYTGGLETSYSGLSTTSWTQSLGSQARITAISVTVGGGTSYSGYVTSCSSSSSCTSNPTLGAASSGTTTTTTAPATCSNGITSLGSTGCTISSYGFVYGTSSNPTLDNGTKVQVGTSYTTTGTSFNTTITGLTAGTSYYIRPYATNGNGTGYGSQTNVTTKSPTSYVVTWKVNGSTYTTGGPTTSVVEENKVTTLPTAPSAPSACSEKTFVGWSTTNIGSTATSTAPSDLFTTAEGSPTITAATTFYAVFMSSSGGGSSVTDNITLTTTGVSSGSTTYSNWTATGTSGAAYAGNSAGGNAAIQMRSNNSTSGIVTTTSGGTASNVTVTWLTNDGNNNRTVNVYGKNTAYSAASDLYNTSTQGTLLGSATYGTSTSITVSGSYTYIGLRSNSGALYLTNVAVTWGGSGGTTEYVTECAAAATYTITWNATQNGGTCSTTTSTVTAGDAVGTLPSATKDCYTLKGWYTTATGNTQVTTSTVPTGNVTYYAQFTQDTYTINYNKGNNGTGTNTSATKNCGENLTLLGAIFTRSSYTQKGWSTSAAGTSKAYDLGGTYTTNAGTTLYPYWVVNRTITWNATTNGGTCATSTTTVPSGDAVGELPTATKEGATFNGWFTQATGGTQITASTTITANVTYYAQFTDLPTYTVTFINGSSTYTTESGWAGKSITVTDPTPCDGFTFEGWSTQQYSSTNTGYPTIDYDGTVPASNTTYYAVYSVQRSTTTPVTNKFEKITSLNELTSGNYLVVGNNNGSTNRAMIAATTGTFYLNTASVTPSSNIITTTYSNRIWQITVAGNHVTLYNANAGQYVQLVPSILGIADEATSFSVSVSGGVWTFTSDTDTRYKIYYYSSNTRFGSHTTAGYPIHLYKQQTQTTYTTYYTTDTSITIEANPNNTTYGSTSITEL